MNANELADNLLKNGGNCSWFKEIATMLRQQQAEIEALKAGKIRAYDNGVEDGRKPNTHPVKELTDEEIKQLQRECISDAYAQAHFHGDKYINSQQAILNFARAILREAQEK